MAGILKLFEPPGTLGILAQNGCHRRWSKLQNVREHGYELQIGKWSFDGGAWERQFWKQHRCLQGLML